MNGNKPKNLYDTLRETKRVGKKVKKFIVPKYIETDVFFDEYGTLGAALRRKPIAKVGKVAQ